MDSCFPQSRSFQQQRRFGPSTLQSSEKSWLCNHKLFKQIFYRMMNKKYTKFCKLLWFNKSNFKYLFCNLKVAGSAERLFMTFHFSALGKLLIFKQIQLSQVQYLKIVLSSKKYALKNNVLKKYYEFKFVQLRDFHLFKNTYCDN